MNFVKEELRLSKSRLSSYYNKVKFNCDDCQKELKSLKMTMFDFFEYWYSVNKDNKNKLLLKSTINHYNRMLSNYRMKIKKYSIELKSIKMDLKELDRLISSLN